MSRHVVLTDTVTLAHLGVVKGETLWGVLYSGARDDTRNTLSELITVQSEYVTKRAGLQRFALSNASERIGQYLATVSVIAHIFGFGKYTPFKLFGVIIEKYILNDNKFARNHIEHFDAFVLIPSDWPRQKPTETNMEGDKRMSV